MSAIKVYRGRDAELPIDTGIDLSGDVVTSQIRTKPSQEGALLAIWTVDFVTDGSDGKLLLTMSSTLTGQISADGGWMDLKRSGGGVVLPIFDEPVPVIIIGSVTE